MLVMLFVTANISAALRDESAFEDTSQRIHVQEHALFEHPPNFNKQENEDK